MELRGFLLDHDYSGSHLDDNGNITILSWNWKILCTQFKFWVKHGMMIWLLTGIQWWWSFFDKRKRKILRRLLRCGNLLHPLLKMSFSSCTQKSLVDYFYCLLLQVSDNTGQYLPLHQAISLNSLTPHLFTVGFR